MNQEERLDYLINYFTKEMQESKQCGNFTYDRSEAPRILRSLMNLWMPAPLSEKFLAVQDAYLKEETDRRGIVDLSDIPTVQESLNSRHPFADRISVWQGDITRLRVDAIVNAANSQMLGCFVPCHGCIDNAIHSAAGLQLRQECAAIMRAQKTEEPTGNAKLTAAYNLPCHHVIHTVGPIVGRTLTEEDCRLLQSCYRSCLSLAEEHGLKSLAFCCISTGEFHFPNDRAAEIAVETVEEYLEHSSIDRVIFNVFKDTDKDLYQAIFRP